MSGHDTRGTTRGRFALLAVGALGVVYGDIGTSPLYAMRETFAGHGHDPIAVTESNVLGILSLIFWSLIVVIVVKYLAFVMKADNQGEGGILTLTALATRDPDRDPRFWSPRKVLVLFGLFGTALLYGDGMITPAISVLSAVEGTELVSPTIGEYTVPIAVVILVALFAVQPRGTATIGRVFGPIMVVWFVVLAVLGLLNLAQDLSVLQAIDPTHAVEFFVDNTFAGFLSLGSVFLVVTGGEALYADMGHFGRRPIIFSWYGLVFPALLLNYFGQGALLIDDPSAIESPFFRLGPEWAIYPMVVLATMATVIASQALISGAFSLTLQAVRLDDFPRIRIIHTSETEAGQIYVPAVNWMLMVACIGLVLGFQSSSNLAAAYGLAVTATMAITTAIFFVVARERLKMNPLLVTVVCSVFIVIDLSYLGANVFKIPAGGWFPLIVGAAIFTILTTWHTGRWLVRDIVGHGRQTLADYCAALGERPAVRAPGKAVFLFSSPGLTPPSLSALHRHTGALPETILVLSFKTDEVPHTDPEHRIEREEMGHGIQQVVAHYGYMEEPDVEAVLLDPALRDLDLHPDTVTYFLGRETLRVTPLHNMATWREHLFAFMSRNATPAANYFNVPAERSLEVGLRVDL